MLQPEQRFRDGQKAHPQFRGEFTARNDLPDGQLSTEDSLPYDHVRFARQTVAFPWFPHRISFLRSSSVTLMDTPGQSYFVDCLSTQRLNREHSQAGQAR